MGMIKFNKPAVKKVASPIAPSEALPGSVVLDFFNQFKKAEAAIAKQNLVKRDLLAAYRKEHGPERLAALKMACSHRLADPDKAAKRDAVTKEAAAYLAMLTFAESNSQ